MRPLQAHCHLGLGTLYAKTGQREQAHAELAAAIDLYRAMEMTFWLPQAEAALAQAGEAGGAREGWFVHPMIQGMAGKQYTKR